MADSLFEVPGYICPYCGRDCSPIGEGPCIHWFAVDGESGWRLSGRAREIVAAASTEVFHDLVYRDADCLATLCFRVADYGLMREVFVFTRDAERARRAFLLAIARQK